MKTAEADRRIARETGVAKRVVELIEPIVGELGYRLVRVRLTGENGATLQVMCERADGDFGIADCEAVSRAISPVLDVEDVVSGTYHLEVSSPGLARPLVRPGDFEDWAGYEAKVEMIEAIDGQRRFRGELEGFADDEVRLFLPAKDGDERVLIGLPFDGIAEARLVMSDELLAAAGKAGANADNGAKAP